MIVSSPNLDPSEGRQTGSEINVCSIEGLNAEIKHGRSTGSKAMGILILYMAVRKDCTGKVTKP